LPHRSWTRASALPQGVVCGVNRLGQELAVGWRADPGGVGLGGRCRLREHSAESRHRTGTARSVYQGAGHRPGVDGDPLARKERLFRPAERRSFPAGPGIPPGAQPVTLVFAAAAAMVLISAAASWRHESAWPGVHGEPRPALTARRISVQRRSGVSALDMTASGPGADGLSRTAITATAAPIKVSTMRSPP
jgi:hypothetical protein